MATLSTETGKRGTTYRVLTYGPDRRRYTIRLGNVSKQIAATARSRIAALEAARAAGVPVDAETAAWLQRIDDAIHERLVKAELAEPREKADAIRPADVTLGEFLERLFASLGPQKRMTGLNYARARRLLEEFFGKERRLVTISGGDADDYKQWLLSPTKDRKAFAPASASVDLRRARQFFKAAVRRKLLDDNPFADVRCGSQANAERLAFVDRQTIEAVIEAAPTAEWRLVFALARYAGLRIPSELEELKWSDVNWERGRLTVRVPKLAHHAGKETRIVPIFAELRPYLAAAFDEAEEGAVYVVPRARGGRNLRRFAEQIVERAGVEKWPRLFQNLRSSREVELMREYPSHVVCQWIGHTAAVARSHYLHATDEDFDRASGGGSTLFGTVQSDTNSGTNSGTISSRHKGPREVAPSRNPRETRVGRRAADMQIPPAGIEDRPQLAVKATTAAPTGTKSGTTDVPDDVHELLRLLAGMTRAERAALIEAARSARRPARRRRS